MLKAFSLSTNEREATTVSTPPGHCANRSTPVVTHLLILGPARISDPDHVCSLLTLHFSQDSSARLEAVHRNRVSEVHASLGARVGSPADKKKGCRVYPKTRGMLCGVTCNERVQHPVSPK